MPVTPTASPGPGAVAADELRLLPAQPTTVTASISDGARVTSPPLIVSPTRAASASMPRTSPSASSSPSPAGAPRTT